MPTLVKTVAAKDLPKERREELGLASDADLDADVTLKTRPKKTAEQIADDVAFVRSIRPARGGRKIDSTIILREMREHRLGRGSNLIRHENDSTRLRQLSTLRASVIALEDLSL